MAFSNRPYRRASLTAVALVGCAEVAALGIGGCGSKADNGFVDNDASASSSGTGSSSGGGRSSSNGGSSSGAVSSSGGGPSGGSSGSSSGGGTSSGSAGASSGGSSSGGPADAGADAQGPPCSTKVTVPTTNPVLVNFETYTGTTAASSFSVVFGGPTVSTWAPPPTIVGYTGFYGFSGGMTNYTLSMVTGETGGTVDGGQDWALDFAITQENVYGGGLGFWMSCANASAFKGISFWARGQVPTNVVGLALGTADTILTSAGGLCTGTSATCLAPQASNLPLTMNWSQIMVPWSMFIGGSAGGTPFNPNGDNLVGLTFSLGLNFTAVDAGPDGAAIYGPIPGNIDFQIDDIQFMP
jgi:hypothetical protein